MKFWFIEWWAGLDWRIRTAVPVLLLLLSTLLFLFGILWIWGWVMGAILLLFAGPSKSEKNGYKF